MVGALDPKPPTHALLTGPNLKICIDVYIHIYIDIHIDVQGTGVLCYMSNIKRKLPTQTWGPTAYFSVNIPRPGGHNMRGRVVFDIRARGLSMSNLSLSWPLGYVSLIGFIRTLCTDIFQRAPKP